MAADVAVQSGVLPVCVVRSLRLESGLFKIRREKTVGIDAEKVSDVHVFRVLEFARSQSDVIDAEVFHLRRNLCAQGHRNQSQGNNACGLGYTHDISCYFNKDNQCLYNFYINLIPLVSITIEIATL